jgi:hypothetical protein
MEEITRILLKIIRLMQILILLGSAISFIYLGILTYLKKIEEAKRNLPLILIGLAILFSAYSAPVLLLSFLEKKELERLAYFQSNPPSFPQVEVIFEPESESSESQLPPETQSLPQPLPHSYSYAPPEKICEEKTKPESSLIRSVKQKVEDVIKQGDVTGYIIKRGDVDFLICIVGRPIVRNNFYGDNGELRHQLDWFVDRLYKIKQKVPAVKNQPAWFTTVFILDPNHSNKLKEACVGKAFFIVSKSRSVLYYCYESLYKEKKYSRNEIDYMISHEAAHALDAKAAGGVKLLSKDRDKEIYKFIYPTPFKLETFKNNYVPFLEAMASFMQGSGEEGSKMCPNFKFKFAYFDPQKPFKFKDDGREVTINKSRLEWCLTSPPTFGCGIHEIFADMYGFFLACDSNLNFPDDPALKAKFEEFLQILKKYNLL